MKKKVFVNIEDVLRIQKERSKINRLKFRNIAWCKDHKEIHIPQEIKDDWELCGLNNCDFITTNMYKTKPPHKIQILLNDLEKKLLNK